MADVIEGASVSMKTMADGTLRLTVDIEPRNAQTAFALFGSPGRAMALAALLDGSGAVAAPDKPKPKGGEWAKLAGIWCNDPEFYAWIRPIYDRELGGLGEGHGDLEMGVDVKDAQAFCRHAVLYFCDIRSRAELDHNPEALEIFNHRLRRPFMRHMQARGIVR